MQDFSNLPAYQEPEPDQENISIGNDSSEIPDSQPAEQTEPGAQQAAPATPTNPETAPAPTQAPVDTQPAVSVEAQTGPTPQPAVSTDTTTSQPTVDTPSLDTNRLVEVDLNSGSTPMETSDLQADLAPVTTQIPQVAPDPINPPAATSTSEVKPAFNVAGVNNTTPTPQPTPEAAAPAQQSDQSKTNKPKFNVIGVKNNG